jgi:anti-anti-sigma regulatory factor
MGAKTGGASITPHGHGSILFGELDMAGAPEFAEVFADVLGYGGPVSIDMRQLTFMDSSGIPDDRVLPVDHVQERRIHLKTS